jgi:hypothetical protein
MEDYRRGYQRIQVAKYLKENKKNTLDVILDLLDSKDNTTRVEIATEIMGKDTEGISSLLGISARTLSRIRSNE